VISVCQVVFQFKVPHSEVSVATVLPKTDVIKYFLTKVNELGNLYSLFLLKTILKGSIMNSTNRKIALITGISILVMAVIAGFAYSFALKKIYTLNDAFTTLSNLKDSILLFRVMIFSYVVILILDVLVAWGLYVFFKEENEPMSLLSSWFRLIYAAVLGVSLSGLSSVLPLSNGVLQDGSSVMISFQAFLDVWSWGLIIFGCHLFVLGLVVFRAVSVPKVFGILILIASVCYIVTNIFNQIVPNYSQYKDAVDMILGLPMAFGELGLAIWLLFKGGKKKLKIA
jgi:hypothetical protein